MKCHVIMPVGPGHGQLKHRAIESVRIAMMTDMGPFNDVTVRTIEDTDGKLGRSKARNMAVAQSDADWLFFLDADDLMHPWAFRNVASYIPRFDPAEGAWAIWGTVVEIKDNVLHERYQVPSIRSFDDLITFDPYMTLQMGHFVRRDVAIKYPFDQGMDVGEDWDYYLRIWKHGRCRKVNAPFMINVRGQHSVGPRAANGKQWREVVEPMLAQARQENEPRIAIS